MLNLLEYWMDDNIEMINDDKLIIIYDNIANAQYNISGFDLFGLGESVFNHPEVITSLIHHSSEVGEGVFRLVTFDWTTGYGLYPGQALWIIFHAWAVLILVYIWPIQHRPRSPNPASGIYRIWSTDRIETARNEVKLATSAKVERLQGEHWWHSLTYAAQFSLLSAFHIGWKEFNVGSWIARIQSREYVLRATGWVRVVSGLQSLLSVYLLAIWALTYFGRPFQ
jgi:hypothetical protein